MTIDESVKLRRGELKQALIDLTFELAADGRLTQYTMRDLADDLGVSPGAAYRHFKSKDQLISAAASQLMTRLGKVFERNMLTDFKGVSDKRIIKSICDSWVQTLKLGSRYYELWLARYWIADDADSPENKIDEINPPSYFLPALRELKSRGVTNRHLRPEEIMVFSLAIDGFILKFGSGKIGQHLETYGLVSTYGNKKSIDDAEFKAEIEKLGTDIGLAMLRAAGYEDGGKS